jgi:hypothetical protein
MQTMSPARGVAVAGRGVLSAGAVLILGAGLALYQLTSLVLGPAGSRQLDLSLTIPTIEVADPSEPVGSSIVLMVGTRATPDPSTSAVLKASLPRHSPSPAILRTSSHPATAPTRATIVALGQAGGSHPTGTKVHDDD